MAWGHTFALEKCICNELQHMRSGRAHTLVQGSKAIAQGRISILPVCPERCKAFHHIRFPVHVGSKLQQNAKSFWCPYPEDFVAPTFGYRVGAEDLPHILQNWPRAGVLEEMLFVRQSSIQRRRVGTVRAEGAEEYFVCLKHCEQRGEARRRIVFKKWT